MQIFKYYGTLCSVCVCVCKESIIVLEKTQNIQIFKYYGTLCRRVYICNERYVHTKRDGYIRKVMRVCEMKCAHTKSDE